MFNMDVNFSLLVDFHWESELVVNIHLYLAARFTVKVGTLYQGNTQTRKHCIHTRACAGTHRRVHAHTHTHAQTHQ